MTEKELRNEFNTVSTAVSVLKTDIKHAEETIITQGIAELRSYNGIFIKAYTNVIATITGNLLLIHKHANKSTSSITSKPKHAISLNSIRGVEVNEYKRESKPTEYILFIVYDKTSSTSIRDNSFESDREVDFSTSAIQSPVTNTRSISISAPTLTQMSVASPNCKTICSRILEQCDNISSNDDGNFYHSFIRSLSSLIPPTSNIVHKTNSNLMHNECSSNNRSSSTEESGTNNEDVIVRGSTLTTATTSSVQSHEFVGRTICRRNSFPPRNITDFERNVVVKPNTSTFIHAPVFPASKVDRNSVFSTKLIKRGTFIGESRSNSTIAPGAEASDISTKSGKMITNLILLQERLVFCREKRTLLQDELVTVITNRERSYEIFRLLNMFKRIINCDEEVIIVAIEREILPFIGSSLINTSTNSIDQCVSKMTSCVNIIRNHKTQRKVDQIVKLLIKVIEIHGEKRKFDAVVTRIDTCREKLNELIISAQKNSLHVNMVLSLSFT